MQHLSIFAAVAMLSLAGCASSPSQAPPAPPPLPEPFHNELTVSADDSDSIIQWEFKREARAFWKLQRHVGDPNLRMLKTEYVDNYEAGEEVTFENSLTCTRGVCSGEESFKVPAGAWTFVAECPPGAEQCKGTVTLRFSYA